MSFDPAASASTETPEHQAISKDAASTVTATESTATEAIHINTAEQPSDQDSALMAVAGYLRLCGIQHPDVLRDQSHRILQIVSERECDATKVSLVNSAMSVAIDEMQRIHDHVAQHSITPANLSERDVNNRCVLSFNQVMKDPSLLREGDDQYRRTRQYGERHAVTVIPRRIDRPMRHNGTPELFPVLRPNWWVTMVNRSFEQVGLAFQSLLSPSRATKNTPTISE
ncbi:hypothetical protein LOC67_23745 [Stieleria sp. JC731]|uniref:hypothetical protein n=1 Tax=Pirellulaceae TaxID=2691357 RepID=UPI001E4E3AB7|nr:hypothetical protein [Stieleria sp. JC731]MCC9603574.1 hypothetical protein [Stieleria sp. JC731]